MSRYDDDQNYDTGRSRGRSSVRGTGTGRSGRQTGSGSYSHGTSSRSSTRGSSSRSASSRSSSARGSSGRGGSAGRPRSSGYHSSSHGPDHGRRHRKPRNDYGKLALGGILLIAAIALIVFFIRGLGGGDSDIESETTETSTVPETELQKEVTVDGVNITGMSREQAKEAILKNYPWEMKVVWEEETFDVADLMAGKVDLLLNEVYQGQPKEKYSLNTDGLEEAVKEEVAKAAAKWDKAAKNGSISSYDKDTDKFLFTGAETGLALDQEKLIKDIESALKKKDFDAKIPALMNPVEPEFSEETAKEKYKTISTFTTKTTSNSKRNTNVKLSAEAINGTILQPGEEFSFNKTVGQRTEAKGYKGAAAYNNGEVVEEIGGGVCQTSSTLYNAVLKAGLKTTKRQSHTYEPSYVTPGTDATVSWNGPDYKFVNNSSAAIGIRARYSDQTVTISIYGVPVLEEGVTYSLKSTKLKDIDPPAPTYEEDPTLAPGVEKTKSSGSKGSYWETRLVVKKNDEVISQDVDHVVTYRGHAPVVLRNSTGTMAPTESQPESTVNPNETSSIAPEGAGDGFIRPDSTEVTGPGGGPGVHGQENTNTSNSVSANGPGSTPPTTAAPPATQPSTAPATTAPPAPVTTAAPPADNNGPPIVAPMPGGN
ncbi:vanomycin resistance protein VanB [Clostridiaceae bacterium]|nr:vanomycin resistance protein VanB [Clostridiaceae bacterium]